MSHKQYGHNHMKNFSKEKPAQKSTFEKKSIYDDDNIKKIIIDYIFRDNDLGKLSYSILKHENDLEQLKKERYMVMPNYYGTPAFLVFLKSRDSYYSCIVDRRTLPYTRNKVVMSNVKIFPASCRLRDDIYTGTIIEGMLICNPNTDYKKVFIVSDLITFKGESMRREKIKYKLMNFAKYLECNKLKTFEMQLVINQLVEMKEIKKLLNSIIPSMLYSKGIRGLTFTPEYSGMRLLYHYSNKGLEESPKVKKDSSTDEEKINIPTDKNLSFRMKKTDIIDVYNLYIGKKILRDGKTHLQFIKTGRAYIQTTDQSFYWRNEFSKLESLIVDCSYNKEKDKWVPIKISNKKYPDLVS